MRSSVTLLVVLGVLGAPHERQQPVIRSGVTLVPLDVRVIDRDGKPVTDLTASDFTISENGVGQAIVHFAALRSEPDAAGSEAPLAFADGSAPQIGQPLNRRVFFVHLTRGRHQAFKHGDALAAFLQSLLPQDLAAISAWNRTTDLSPDHSRLREIAARYASRHERIETLINEWFEGLRGEVSRRRDLPPHIQKEIDWVFEPASGMRAATLPKGRIGLAEHLRRSLPPGSYSDAPRLVAALNYLRPIAGEKRVVYVTEFGGGLAHDARRPERSIAARAAHDRITLDVIQTGGTIGAARAGFAGPMWARRIVMPIMPSSGALASFVWQLRDLREAAAETGGLGSTLKRGTEAFAALAELTSFHYVLGYYPANASTAGEYRAISVTVARPGVRIIARGGYFARPPAVALDVREHSAEAKLRQAMTSRRALHGIGVTVTNLTRPSAGELDVQFRIELGHVMFREGNDGRRVLSLEIAAVASGDARQVMGETTRRVDVAMTPSQWEQSVRDGFTGSLRISVAGRVRELRVIAYDFNGDNVGSAIVEVRGR